MVEKEVVHANTLKIESPGKFDGLSKKEYEHKIKWEKLVNSSNEAKSLDGWLKGRIKVANFEQNFDMARLLEAIRQKHSEFERLRYLPLISIEIIDGWKAKDYIQIWDGFTNEFVIESHNKDKETGEIKTSTKIIPHKNVNKILFFIKKWKIGEKHPCYDFTELLGKKSWSEVIGNRTKTYFPNYYYPIKILEALKVIKYGSNGVITRIK